MASFEELLEHLDKSGVDKRLEDDIIHLAPEITYDDAFRLQLASKQRRVAAGDRVIGYQASLTSSGAQRTMPHIPAPMVGTLLASLERPEGSTVDLDDDINFVEAEIGVLLKHDLEGARTTTADVLAAVEAYFPALEVAPVRPGLFDNKWSAQHLLAVQKAPGGYVLFGSRLTSPTGFDLRTEGAITSIDGEVKGSACGVEAMGNPLNVVAAVVRRLATAGQGLKAGQIIMTGSLPAPQIVKTHNHSARIEFTRLGSVEVRITPPREAP
ncbi:MAG TPA: fumarylacetoacetate hydrolase family protein [Steroidobacteraceae bacterium]|nr:fumarylacetoacetate hydrolase family protein [Steroidobacteraceae bacterium]